MVNLRVVLAATIPTLTALLGFLWFRRKKKDRSIEDKPSDIAQKVSLKTEVPVPQACNASSLKGAAPEQVHEKSEGTVSPMGKEADIKPTTSAALSSTVTAVSNKPSSPVRVADKQRDVLRLEEQIQAVVEPSVQAAPRSEPLVNGHVEPVEEPILVAAVASKTAATPPSQTLSVPYKACEPEAVVISSGEEDNQNGETLVISSDEENSTSHKPNDSIADEQDSVILVSEEPAKSQHKQKDIEANNNMRLTSKEDKNVDDKSREGSLDSSECTSDLNGNGSTGSSVCDAQSEVSSDSGKGASQSETPLAASPNSLPEIQVYEFAFPAEYAGLLIGKMGRNVQQLKQKSGADIKLSRTPFTEELQICVITGTSQQVAAALECMKKRFPEKQYPNICYDQLNGPVEMAPPVLTPQIMQMSLPEGVSVDVIVSAVTDVNHIFVQQPTHPTFSSLDRLTFCMNQIYAQEASTIPELPRPVEVGVICAAPMYNGWFRAQVVLALEETDEVDVKFVDYGGYMRLPCSALRQIRSDFTTLPFQAVECYLANVIPPKDAEAFPPEAVAYLEQLVHGKMLQAQILTHEEDGVPYVQLYQLNSGTPLFINREVVDQGMAQWYEMS